MPVYEYSCGGCGPFELRREYRESGAQARCPECGEESRRVYSAPAVSDRTGARGELRRRAERGGEPKIGRRYSPGGSPRPRKGGGRPWQIGH